jgi:tRNA(adenine34) deaminase
MCSPEEDIIFMKAALLQAGLAASMGEVPVGCVIVHKNRLIASACNRRETDKSALAHAELLAIHSACSALGGWRLHQCELYVTLEPCPMCMGAIINARIRRVIFGTRDPKAGCLGSIANFNEIPFNHHPEVLSGVCEAECRNILTDFFSALRAKKDTKKLNTPLHSL